MKPIVWTMLVTTLLAVGCKAPAHDGGDDAPGPDADTDTDTDSDTDVDTNTDTGSGTGFEECSEVSESANNSLSKVDIIIAVDSSGSMTAEAGFVQESLNGFSSQIVESGVDAHIVLISATSTMSNGICVGEPLGSGVCPDDSNPPNFLHEPTVVNSSDALMLIHSTYYQWDDMLREGSMRHVVVVTDDNSSFGSTWFVDIMADVWPPFDTFTFHAIAAPYSPWVACAMDPPHACCEYAASSGLVYWELTELTGGIFSNLCAQAFAPVFDQLAAIVADVPIACEWEIPEPPDDQVFDPQKVNVDYIDGEDFAHPIGYVETVEDCEDVEHAWYYDDPEDPAYIRVCPQTCAWIQDDPTATIVIKFGCETEGAVE